MNTNEQLTVPPQLVPYSQSYTQGITSSEVLGSHIGKQQHPHNVIMTPHLKFSNANAYSTLYEESHQFKRSNSQNEFDYINSSGRVVFGEQHCDNLNNFNFGSHHQ